MQTTATLVSHEQKSGTTNGRDWRIHIFTTEDGTSYSTFDTDVANKAYGLLNQSATVTFEQKPASNPAYPPRNTIIGIVEGGQQAGLTPASFPVVANPATSTIPTFPQNIPFAPASSPEPINRESGDHRELRIMRQSAIDRAIAASAAGLISPDLEAVYAFSEELIGYFQNGTKRISPRTLEDEFAGTGF